MSTAALRNPVIEFPRLVSAGVLELDRAEKYRGLLEVWTAREYFRHCARHGLAREAALRAGRACRRVRELAPARVQRVAWEEYARMSAEAAEALGNAEGGTRSAEVGALLAAMEGGAL